MNYSSKKCLLTRLFTVGAGLSPVLGFGMGLGDIEIISRLNQPLHARIEVVDVSDDEWRQFHVRLNSGGALEAGITRPEILNAITLRPLEDANHRHFIEIKSNAAFTEPLFDLPVDAGGPSARVIRNYTVLLDPPGPNADAPKGATESADQTPNAPAVSPILSAPAQTAESSQHVYIVNKSDTMGRIARRIGGRTAAQRRELIQWIYEHNPQAFYGGIHRLHAGARLTLPQPLVASQPRPNGTMQQPQTSQPATAARKTGTPENTAEPPNPAQAAGELATQIKLAQQLEALEQTLALMQKTISTQSEEIDRLTARVAAQARQQRAEAVTGSAAGAGGQRSAPSGSAATDSNASSSATEIEDEGDEQDSTILGMNRGTFYWLAGGLGLLAIAGVSAGMLVLKSRRRAVRPLAGPKQPVVELGFADRDDAPVANSHTDPWPKPERRQSAQTAPSDRSAAWSMIQAAPWTAAQPVQPPPPAQSSASHSTRERTPAGHDDGERNPDGRRPEEQTVEQPVLKRAGTATAIETADLPQAYLEDLPPELIGKLPEVYLEELPAAYIAKLPAHDPNAAAIHGDTEMLPQTDPRGSETVSTETLPQIAGGDAETEMLPIGAVSATDPDSHSATTRQAQAVLMQDERSLVNKEVAEILEKSLGSDPNRVDVRIKLLEIYHHEVQGNRAEFNSLLDKLVADPRSMTPAQRQHVEKLQRTLSEEKPDDGHDFVTKVAI